MLGSFFLLRFLRVLDGVVIRIRRRQLRADGVLLPVLMLTARDSVGDRVAGLDAGADDYLVKPFALRELLARCAAARSCSSVGSSRKR